MCGCVGRLSSPLPFFQCSSRVVRLVPLSVSLLMVVFNRQIHVVRYQGKVFCSICYTGCSFVLLMICRHVPYVVLFGGIREMRIGGAWFVLQRNGRNLVDGAAV